VSPVLKQGMWLLAGVWLVASCSRPAADGGESHAAQGHGEVREAQPTAAPAPESEPAGVQPGAAAPSPSAEPSPEPTKPERPTAPDPILAAHQAVPVSEQQDVPVPGELRLAMEEFAEALREHDAARVLGKFSRAGGFRYVDTRKSAPSIQPIGFDRAERELNAKAGLFRALLDPAGLTQYVSSDHAIPWLWIAPDEFAPRGVDAKKVWLRWRAEGDAWVVDTIAMPAALPRAR
jgi:hypothetical protein